MAAAIPAPGPGPLEVIARGLRTGLVVLGGLIVVAALAVAAVSVALVGVLLTAAAMAFRFRPQPKTVRAGEVLEGRRTPDGWVVELRAR